MKISYYLFLNLLILFSTPISAKIVGTLLEEITISSNFLELNSISYADDVLDYTEGGITFTYESGLFTEPPCIRVSVELLDAIPTVTDAYIATVTYNDAYSTGVIAEHIYDIIEEAPTNSVRIHLAATGR